MGDMRSYEKYIVNYNESAFQVGVENINKTFYCNYSDVNRVEVYESSEKETGRLVLDIAATLAGVDELSDRILGKAGKKYAVNLLFKNGEEVSFVLSKKTADTFSSEMTDRIWRFRMKNSVFGGRWENARRGDHVNNNPVSESSGVPWFCPNCGRTNGALVNTCSCGKRKDGTQTIAEGMTKRGYEEQQNVNVSGKESVDTAKKWRCKKCKAINDGRMMKCVCGTPRFEPDGNGTGKESTDTNNPVSESPVVPWFCPNCGRTNGALVNTCSCGRSKDGTLSIAGGKTEPEYEGKHNANGAGKESVDTAKKWRCKNCKAINDGRMMKCVCGTPRFESDGNGTKKGSTDITKKWRCKYCWALNDGSTDICYCGRTRAETEAIDVNDSKERSDVSARAGIYEMENDPGKGKSDLKINHLPGSRSDDGAVKLKLSYSSETVRIKIDQVMIRDTNKCGISFSGEQEYGKPVDAILCNVKLLDSFDEILSQDKVSFLIAENSGAGFVTEYEEIKIDDHLYRRIRKADIEVLRIAFI